MRAAQKKRMKRQQQWQEKFAGQNITMLGDWNNVQDNHKIQGRNHDHRNELEKGHKTRKHNPNKTVHGVRQPSHVGEPKKRGMHRTTQTKTIGLKTYWLLHILGENGDARTTNPFRHVERTLCAPKQPVRKPPILLHLDGATLRARENRFHRKNSWRPNNTNRRANLMDNTGLKESIELAKIRATDKKAYESLMENLFVVHTDFIVFEREMDKIYKEFEKAWEKEDK